MGHTFSVSKKRIKSLPYTWQDCKFCVIWVWVPLLPNAGELKRFSNAKWRHQFDHHPTTPLWLLHILHTSLWLLNTSKSKPTQRSRKRWAKHLHSCQLPSVVHTQLYSVQVVLKYDTLLSLCCLWETYLFVIYYIPKKVFFLTNYFIICCLWNLPPRAWAHMVSA